MALVLVLVYGAASVMDAEEAPAAGASPRQSSYAVVTPNDFEGSDTARINQAITEGVKNGRRVVIPRENRGAEGTRNIWLLDSAILLESGLLLELENCHIKLSDRCRDNFMRSANCGLGIEAIEPMSNIHVRGVGSVLLEGADHPRASGDSAKTLGERSYGTDAGKEGESQTGDWRNIGILMAFVDHFSFENIRMKDSHCWGMSMERCSYGVIRDIEFEATQTKEIDGKTETLLNQDGVDLRQGCHNITIENITGYSGDDLVALTNILSNKPAGSSESTMVSASNDRGDGQDDIRYIVVRNIRGHCAGGHHIIRLLNARGLRIHDVTIDGLLDTSGSGKACRAAVKIGDSNPVWGGVTPLGDTYRIFVNNITSRALHTVLIAGSLAESSLTNIRKYEAEGEAITFESGKENVRNVEISNIDIPQQSLSDVDGFVLRRVTQAAIPFRLSSGAEHGG